MTRAAARRQHAIQWVLGIGIAMSLSSCKPAPLPAPPPPPPPIPHLDAFAGAAPAEALLSFDLRDASEVLLWELLSGVASSDATRNGLALTTEGPDPILSRAVSIPRGGIDQIEVETREALAGPFRVYVLIDDQISEAWALDAAPLEGHPTIQVADLGGLPTPRGAITAIRIDPPQDAGTWTLVGVRVRPRARDGLTSLEGDARWCRRSPAVSVPASNLGRDRLRVSFGLPARGSDDRHGTLLVDLADADGTVVQHGEHRVRLRPGWAERIVDVDGGAAPRDLTLRLSLRDPDGELVDACYEPPVLLARRTSMPARPNVLLVSLDTLRADHLDRAPFLSRLAQEGRSFPNAWASSNFTLASHASLLTGVSPLRLDTPALGLESPFLGTQIPARFPTFAEILRDAGYETAATTDGGMIASMYGFARGFARYHVPPPGSADLEAHERFAAEVASGSGDRPFFLFVHSYVAHDYYLNTPRYHDDVDPVRERALVARGDLISEIRHATANPDYTGRLYAAGVQRADELLEGVVAAVRAASDDAPLLVVVTSDHGESFGAHTGVWHHGTSLLDEQLRVPIVFWSNGPDAVPGPALAPTGAVDVVPSLLRRLGIDAPASCSGESDRFLGATPAPARREPLLATQNIGGAERYALTDGTWKYLRTDRYGGENESEHCFDLASDAAERSDRFAERPPACLALRDALAARIAAETPRALLVRSDVAFGLEVATPESLVAVRSARPAPLPLVGLVEGVVAWKPADPDDLLAIVVRGSLPRATHLAIAGVEAPLPDGLFPVGTDAAPARVEVHLPDGAIAAASIAARDLDDTTTPAEILAPDPAVLEQLRALGYTTDGTEEGEVGPSHLP